MRGAPQKRGVFGAIKREPRRRCAIEPPVIGYMKAEASAAAISKAAQRMLPTILTAIGYNLHRILA